MSEHKTENQFQNNTKKNAAYLVQSYYDQNDELVKEGKKSVAEYIERKVATVQYLLENIHKKTQSIQIESEDILVTSFCILCSRCLVLPVGRPVCQSETVYDLVEESI
ncbi:MAG: hypothetical protein H8D35_04340 [Nitrosopumilus sp.]|nr:hypothetical protein [Nitrosopumilus sp.]